MHLRNLVRGLRTPRLPPTAPGQRIVVVGTSGSGKTTMAKTLADRLDLVHVELDAEAWLPEWTMRERSELEARLEERLAGPAWVVDGNYSSYQHVVWASAQTVVWLDYPLPVVMAQVIKRTVQRVRSQETLWGTNRESFRQSFMTRDSIIWWALKTWASNRARYDAQLADCELDVVQLRGPAEARRWLDERVGRNEKRPPSGGRL